MGRKKLFTTFTNTNFTIKYFNAIVNYKRLVKFSSKIYDMKCVQTIIGLAITLSIVSLKNVEGRRSFRTGISGSIVTDDKNEHSVMCPTTINGCRQKCLHNPCFFQYQRENIKKYSTLTLVPSSVHFERKPLVTKCKCICESVEADGTPFTEDFRPVTNPIPYQCSEEHSYRGNPMKFFERPRGKTRKGEEDMVLPKKYCKNILPREGEDLMQWKGDRFLDKFNTPWRVRYPVDKKTILCTGHIQNPSFNLMMEKRKGFLDSIPRTLKRNEILSPDNNSSHWNRKKNNSSVMMIDNHQTKY